MTTEQLQNLKTQLLPNNFIEYKKQLVDEAYRLGHTNVNLNSIIEVLEAAANDNNKIITETHKDETQQDKGGNMEQQQQELDLEGNNNGGSQEGDQGGDNKNGENIKSKQDELAKRIEEASKAEAEAKRKKKEADKLKKELEELNKKLEEKRKKEEEERKRKEEERKHNEEEDSDSIKHYKTDELIETLKTTGIAYLVGPAGTGKSTLAMDACETLYGIKKDDWKFKEHFAQISFSPDTTSSEMIGRCDINGNFHKSDVVRVFGEGGLILFDEIDNADASMLVKLNTALANGHFSTPEGLVRRHKDTYIVCTANTYGTGPDAMYVGRSRLDAATLDRFVLSTIEVDYDIKLEKKMMRRIKNEEDRKWLAMFTKCVRKAIREKHFRRICSTRFVIAAIKWLCAGHDRQWVVDRFFLGWSDNEVSAVTYEQV